MKLTKSTKVITKSELMNKIIKSSNNDANDDDTVKEDLQSDISLIAKLYNSKSLKFVALSNYEYIPLNDYLNHYHTVLNANGIEVGTSFDTNNVLVVDL